VLEISVEVIRGTSVWEIVAAVGTAAAAVATFFAVLVALFGREWWDRRHRPILEISYESREPYCRDTQIIIETHGAKSTVGAYWVRVKVMNEGRATAKGCKGKMIAVYNDDGNLRQDRDPMLLRWAGMPPDQALHPLDLARGESQFLDVVFARADDHEFAFIAADPTPAGFFKTLEAGQKHKATLAVYADSVEPVTADFVITYGGDVDSLKMDWA